MRFRLALLPCLLAAALSWPAAAQHAPAAASVAPLDARVAAAVAERWGGDPAEVTLEWGAARDGWTPPADSRFELLGSGADGHWVVVFPAVPPSTAERRLRLRAGMTAREPVAARDLPRGVTLTEEDVEWRETVRWGPPARGGDDAVVSGWVTRRRIPAGEPLREPAIDRPAAVVAGQPVRLLWSRGGVSIEMLGVAAGSAALGERVAVRAETGRRLQGTAIGPASVRIGLDIGVMQ